jgi:hypothetical protein
MYILNALVFRERRTALLVFPHPLSLSLSLFLSLVTALGVFFVVSDVIRSGEFVLDIVF